MLKKLQRRFILVAALSYLIAMLMVLGLINAIVFIQTIQEAEAKIDVIAANMGEAPEDINSENFDHRYFTVEFPYESRYFSVLFDEDGNAENVSVAHIAALDEISAAEIAGYVLDDGSTKGVIRIKDQRNISAGLFERKNLSSSDEVFWHTVYVYKVSDTDESGKIVVFLDNTSEDAKARGVLILSVWIGFSSFVLVLVLCLLLSKRAVLPMIKNIEQQKSFITNAGHELKTPLAIISANAEVLEMTNGGNEWTESIRHQVERLTGLIDRLIRLSRLQESSEKPVLTEMDYSATVKEMAESFRPLIENSGKKLEIDIQDGINEKGEVNAVKELVNILLDNAQKYCDESGTVDVRLSRDNFRLCLDISNTYTKGGCEDCNRYFERFYRADESHNSKKAGYGIGLSMAQELSELLKGKISACWKDNTVHFTVSI